MVGNQSRGLCLVGMEGTNKVLLDLQSGNFPTVYLNFVVSLKNIMAKMSLKIIKVFEVLEGSIWLTALFLLFFNRF